jgi:hypothetical protein
MDLEKNSVIDEDEAVSETSMHIFIMCKLFFLSVNIDLHLHLNCKLLFLSVNIDLKCKLCNMHINYFYNV